MTDAPSMHPVGLLLILGMGFLLLLLPRRLAVLPIIATVCFTTLGLQLIVAGFHFTPVRIIILFGWIRLIVRGEYSSSEPLNIIDKLVIAYSCVILLPLFRDSNAIAALFGTIYNLIGGYFLFRFLIRDIENIEESIKIIGFCLIPLAAFMIVEMYTGKNIFSRFGGVPEIPMFREGYWRCQGPFRHAILAGSIGAGSIPLLIGLLSNRANRSALVMLAIVATAVITATSHSSGPAIAYIFGLIGLLAWIWRKKMHLIRWGILFALISAHILMKAPFWYIIVRVSDVIGGGGWHRAYLIDQAINKFGDWWLTGTSYTADWMPYVLEINPNASDITNQFIAEGVSGGLLRMSLFIAIIVVCFRTVGRTLVKLKDTSGSLPFLVWGLGASLLSHITSFFSVSYFDQTIFIWYMLWAMISALITSSSSLPDPTHDSVSSKTR